MQDGDGEVSPKELHDFLSRCGIGLPDQQLDAYPRGRFFQQGSGSGTWDLQREMSGRERLKIRSKFALIEDQEAKWLGLKIKPN